MQGGVHIEKVDLGKSNLQVSPIAIGTGTNGWGNASDQTRKGADWLPELLENACDLGLSFWDLADQYGSHPQAGSALRRLDRAKIVINTKTTATSYDDCRVALDRFFSELGTDYLDSVLLHGKSKANWNKTNRGAMDALSEAKAEGRIRAVGISSHGLGALKTAAAEPWVDIILARLNYDGVNMDGSPARVIPVLKKAKGNGKGIVAMKVLGCGKLASNPEKCIKFVLESGCIDAMTLGFLSAAEMQQSLDLYTALTK